MNRRDLIQRVLLGTTALIVMPPAFTSCSKDDAPVPDPGTNPGTGTGGGNKITLDLTLPENSVLNNVGGSKIVQTLLVASTAAGYIALSSICTHEGCGVSFDSTASNIKCGCHGSSFTTAGSVITGPATMPLASYNVSKTGNILTISL
jgi:Rieske Fe-S protein